MMDDEEDQFDILHVFGKPQTPRNSKQRYRQEKFLLSPSSLTGSSISADTSVTSLSNFSLSPARSHLSASSSSETADLIDYSCRSGSLVYEQATEALFPEGALFDGNPDDLSLFKDLIWERAMNQGWMENGANIFTIPLTKDSGAAFTMNLLEQDGYFSFYRLREWATDMILKKRTRLAQNDYQFYWCLRNSISVELKKELLQHRSDYFIEDTPIGILYFHLLLSKIESANNKRSCGPKAVICCWDIRHFKKPYKNTETIMSFIGLLIGIIAGSIAIYKHFARNKDADPNPNVSSINSIDAINTYQNATALQDDLRAAIMLLGQLLIHRMKAMNFSPSPTQRTLRWLENRTYDMDDIDERNADDWFHGNTPSHVPAPTQAPSQAPSRTPKHAPTYGGYPTHLPAPSRTYGPTRSHRVTPVPTYIGTSKVRADYNYDYGVVKSNGVHVFAGFGMTLIVWDARIGTIVSETRIHTNDTEGVLPCWERTDQENCYAFQNGDEVESPIDSRSRNRMSISNFFLGKNQITVIVKSDLSLKSRSENYIQGYRQTRVFVYDISDMPSDATELELLTRKDLQGSFKSGKMIGENVHIVTSSSLRVGEVLEKILSPNEVLLQGKNDATGDYYMSEADKTLSIKARSISKEINNEIKEIGIEPDDIATISQMLIQSPNNTYVPWFTRFAVLKNLIITYSFASDRHSPDGDNFTMSQSGIFLSTPDYTNPFYYSDKSIVIASEAYEENEDDGTWSEITALISLTLDGPQSQFHSNGIVRGSALNQTSINLGTSALNSSFEYLRIATTTRGRWIFDGQFWKQNDESNNHVSVLTINSSKRGLQMEKVGHLDDFDVGGRMIGCVYHKNHCYILTEKDPIYILDFSNQTAPELLGNFTAPGKQKYIQPINDTLIIIIGQEIDKRNEGWEYPWFKTPLFKLQVSMFNVANSKNPILVGSLNQSGAEAMYDHESFRYMPESNMLIFPSQCTVKDPYLCGFDVYDLSRDESATTIPTTFTKAFQILNHDSCRNSFPPRSLGFGDNVTTLMGCTVKSTNIPSEKEMWMFRIESQAI